MRAFLIPLLLVLVPPSRAASGLTPARHHPVLTGIVAAGLSEYHYAARPLDDQLSACWLNAAVEATDPGRSFFTAEDRALFARFERDLDDRVKASPPDLVPAFAIEARFAMRARERVAWTRAALLAPLDLLNDERLVADRSKAPWAADEAALKEIWRQELEEDWIRLSLEGIAEEEIPTTIGKRMDRLEQFLNERESADVIESWLEGLTTCYDPHTAYMKPVSADDFAISTSGSLEGIGAQLSKDGELVTITEVLPGGPAAQSNELLKDDRIVGVAQGQEAFVDVVGMRLDKVVRLIRGPKGTTVRLKVIPARSVDPAERREVSLVRDRIDLEAVEPTLEIVEQVTQTGTRRVAVIELPAFVGEATDAEGGKRPSSTQRMAALLAEAGAVDAVVLDLRANGGGILEEAVGVAGLFIKTGPVVQIRDGSGQIEVMEDRDKSIGWAGPLLVLTSPASASASEIVAGALRDHGRAIIVGSESTFGKGTVQSVVPLDPILSAFVPELNGKNLGGVLKLTFSQYYLPAGQSTQAIGVPSDVVLPSPLDGRLVLERDRPQALPADQIPSARPKADRDLASLRSELSRRSVARIADDPHFAAMSEMKRLIDEMDERTELSLVLAERQAESTLRKERWEALEAKLVEHEDPVREEALRVAADLADLW